MINRAYPLQPVINGSATDTIVRPSRRDTINFCRIIRGWKTPRPGHLWPYSLSLSFSLSLSIYLSLCLSIYLSIYLFIYLTLSCSLSLSLSLWFTFRRFPLYDQSPLHLCAFIESRPVNCFTSGVVANSNDVSVLVVTLKVTPSRRRGGHRTECY